MAVARNGLISNSNSNSNSKFPVRQPVEKSVRSGHEGPPYQFTVYNCSPSSVASSHPSMKCVLLICWASEAASAMSAIFLARGITALPTYPQRISCGRRDLVIVAKQGLFDQSVAVDLSTHQDELNMGALQGCCATDAPKPTPFCSIRKDVVTTDTAVCGWTTLMGQALRFTGVLRATFVRKRARSTIVCQMPQVHLSRS